MRLEILLLLHAPLRNKIRLKTPSSLHALPSERSALPGVELGQKRSDPLSSLALPAAASHFVKEEENPGFSANTIHFFLFCSSRHVPARNMSCHLCGRVPAGLDRELLHFCSSSSPTSFWPRHCVWYSWELPGRQQAASFAQRPQPGSVFVLKSLLTVLTSTSQEVSPPTQSQLTTISVQDTA